MISRPGLSSQKCLLYWLYQNVNVLNVFPQCVRVRAALFRLRSLLGELEHTLGTPTRLVPSVGS